MDEATRRVSLWFENDYVLYSWGQEFADDSVAFEDWAIDFLTENMVSGLGRDVFQDLLSAVDWRVIADNLREDS